MTVHALPIWIVDVIGSILMIGLSIACLLLTLRLRRRDESNVIWTYLMWVCYGLAGFAISRGVGHLLKQMLLLSGHEDSWAPIRPYSGAINTVMFMAVGSITLFFERTWKIYQNILRDRYALQTAHKELLYLNQNLEHLVADRTEELAASEQKYRSIFERSRDMILVSRTDGTLIDINPAGYEMLGLDPKKDLTDAGSLEKFFADGKEWMSILGTVERKGFVANAELDLLRSDGGKIRVLLSAGLNRGSGDGERTIHFLVKDIEQKRLMEQQIAQADKLASIGELSAGIAHEINNPLGVILGYTQLLLRSENPGSMRHGDLKTIEKHVQNCQTIVEDLLNFSRSSRPKKELFHVHQIIDDVLHFIQQHTKAARIQIEREYDTAIPQVLLDEKKIRQVIMNLVMNARHAVSDGGKITITTGLNADENRLFIRVSDTGYGIEKKNLTRIFDPFFTTKPTGEGTGLGLSVSYGIIKSHGGDIFVDSTPGKGSTFTVVLPVNGRK